MNNKERQELAMWAVEFAKKKGASEVAASISNSRSVEIEVREQKIETIKESTSNGLNLNIYRDHKYSGHSTNNLNKKDLEKFISEAVEATKFLTADEFRELPDPSLYPTDLSKDLKLEDKSYANVTPEQRVNISKEIEQVARSKSDKIISATGGFSDDYSESVLVHSNGLVADLASTSFWAGGSVTIKDGDARPEGWHWGGDRYFTKMPSAQELGAKSAENALRKVGQTKIASGKYDMLIENRTSGRLLSLFFGAMRARSIQQKSSYLDGMIGEQIASPLLTIIDDPFIEGGFASRLYDGQGIAAHKRTMIEKGVLKEYYIDNYYGKKLGMKPNGGSNSNILFDYGSRDFDGIVKDVQNGIFVTSFNGGNSNSTTGDFSFGVSGFLVEGGKIVKAVNEMNISGNSKEFWKQLAEVGNDPYKYSSILSPTLLFEDIDFSGL
ncbi:TldD/PmbA family protein [Carboxylicivirga marina]|uniref:TldD/PmbA family protein n=1 Tax=Carboxylicivirga marina TaxID=2800988 RepID=A0ABS1HMX6_9BACT|nr:TldD/PmbA family protein [Carboxylicivirga marina]MBK3518945.1 TldD/PmbA family protein [Carboxylicivirga marina]